MMTTKMTLICHLSGTRSTPYKSCLGHSKGNAGGEKAMGGRGGSSRLGEKINIQQFVNDVEKR